MVKPPVPPIPLGPPPRWGARAAAAAAVMVLAAAAGYGVRHWSNLQADRHFRAATSLLESAAVEPARAELRAALERAPRHCAARHALAELELAQGRVEAAFLEFQSLAELCPAETGGWSGLARTWFAAGMPASAEDAATRAIELQRAQPAAEAFLLRARIRATMGRHYGAAIDAGRALALAPGNAEATSLAGASVAPLREPPEAAPVADRFWPGQLAVLVKSVMQHIQQRNWAAAREAADIAGRDYPRTMLAPWLAGVIAYAHGQFSDAERQLRIALAFAPRSSRVATNLAGAWAKQQGPEFAARQLLELQRADPEFLVPLDIAATAFLELRQPAKAQQALERALALATPPPKAFLQLASFYRDLDRTPDALRICDQGLQRWPGDAELGLCRAQLQALSGDAAAAAGSYEELLAARPDAWAPRVALASLLARRDDAASRARALKLARSLQADGPGDAEAFDAIGWALLRSGDARAARPWLAAAARAQPADPALRYHFGAALAQLKEKSMARNELQAATAATAPFAERPDAQRLLNELGG